jgi:three-Cys-motif partner protein
VQKLCDKDWTSRRAVLFLDPYGMQVEWRTIEAIAATKAIDLWLLFPLGIGVNRLLTKSGDIPESWRNRLNLLLGDGQLVQRIL